MSFFHRHINTRIKQTLKNHPIVFLNGARQTGKSTLVKTMAAEIGTHGKPAQYVTFDRPTQMAAASSEPEAFLTSYDLPLIIDEVQLVPELFRTLKIVVDAARFEQQETANGKYLLTGSANILALPNLSDPLVGRMAILTLYPFSAAEATNNNAGQLEKIMQLDFQHITDRGLTLLDAMKRATFPEIASATEENRRTWFDGYITTILQRDVKQIAELEKSSLLPHLLRVLATRAGGLMNDSDIAREVGLNSVTGKSYRNILKLMFLTFDVNPWFRNVGKRLVKSAKGYFLDTSMICHLLDYNLEDISKTKPELFGHLVENFVATELKKQLSNSDIKAELYHFRTSDNKEVDFIIEKPDGSVFAIEVKKSETVNADDFKGIKAFQELTGKDFTGGIVLYSGKEAVPFGKNLWAVPFFALW
ncbi:ATP-binding protein [Sediminibacterium sp.]|uniref:ATP-binding protein n=1 Tax=Sediminibacterium sp. TaxID=1917865 RepID=UPI0025EF7474|nr:ATP-binding protein [Sediminibacterium sp.]MBW0176666.1 ATP-binding protein [Sediminibacterium sp.]